MDTEKDTKEEPKREISVVTFEELIFQKLLEQDRKLDELLKIAKE